MGEEQQIAALQAQIKAREAEKKRIEDAQRRAVFWKGEVAPVMVLFLLVALFIMLSQCLSIIRITG